MADYSESYRYMARDEFNSPDTFLHKNKGEKGLTIGGLYQKWHPKAVDWDFISRIVYMNDNDLYKASFMLYKDKEIHKQLFKAFKWKFWDKNKLDYIKSQTIANKLFSSVVNLGNKQAIKIAQKIVEVKEDGISGQITVGAINEMDEVDFINLYIIELKKYYDSLIAKNGKLAIFKNGWYNRANRIA